MNNKKRIEVLLHQTTFDKLTLYLKVTGDKKSPFIDRALKIALNKELKELENDRI